MSGNNINTKKRPLEEEEETNNNNNDIQENQDEITDDIVEYKRLNKKKLLNLQRSDCPFLDTVNRYLLDFDFSKKCSVSLNTLNVYACLVCGKYFQGKSQDSHANIHCLQNNHHVFINLQNSKIYCLPEDYEVIDPSLDDIKYLLNPVYNKESLKELDLNCKFSRALNGTQYLPGMVGLNNITNNSYFNVIIQLLSKIPMFRDYLIDSNSELNSKFTKSQLPLISSLSDLVKKIWNPKNFKSHVSPHDLLQVVKDLSKRKFLIGENADPLDFLQWVLNTCHQELGGTKQLNSSIIYSTFAGEIEVTTKKLFTQENSEQKEDNDMESKEKEKDQNSSVKKYSISKTKQPFLFLSLDLPPRPLFVEKEKSILPQISLYTLLEKYDGRENAMANGDIKMYKLLHLPKYLILVVKRFLMNNFFLEKESTIVNFPLLQLDLSDYVENQSEKNHSKYNLHSLIKHEGEPKSGLFSIYIHHKSTEKWFLFQDLNFSEAMNQLVMITECYLLIYEKV